MPSLVKGGALKLKGGVVKKSPQGRPSSSSANAPHNDASEPSRAHASLPARTPAEQRHLEQLTRRRREQLEKGEPETHRDRVAKLNAKLAALPEHYDVPKTSGA